MATDRRIQAERQTKYPALWSLTETFLRNYGGKVHINWGAPFSVKTKVMEGRLEVDFDAGRLDVRLEHTSAPPEVSFTTDPDLFSGHLFDEQIGDCGAELGWKVQGGNN